MVSLLDVWGMGLILTDFRWSRTRAMPSALSNNTIIFSKDRRLPYQSKDSINSHNLAVILSFAIVISAWPQGSYLISLCWSSFQELSMHCLFLFWSSQWFGVRPKRSRYTIFGLINSNFTHKLRKVLISFIQFCSLISLISLSYSTELI